MSELKIYDQTAQSWKTLSANVKILRNTVTLTQAQSNVVLGIIQYNAQNDELMVYKNSVYIENGDTADGYSINTNGISIDSLNGSWPSGTIFNFIVLKNVLSNNLSTTDGSLIQPKSITTTQLADSIVSTLNNALEKNSNGNYVIGSRSFVQEYQNDLWITANAYLDSNNVWQRVDTTKFSFALQMQGSGNIPGETVQGTNIWRCVPGANPINSTFATYGGWEACLIFTANQNMVCGGENFEIDGSGASLMYGRINQIADGTYFSKNAFNDGSAWQRDTTSSPATAIHLGNDGSIKTQHAPAASNPISWTISNVIDDGNGNASIKGYLTIGNVSSLPTASATYRGQIIYVQGDGTTTADIGYMCMMSSTGTYSWKQIISG